MRPQAVNLYAQALEMAITVDILPPKKRNHLLHEVIDLNYAWAAIYNNTLVGMAGYQCPQGSLTGGSTAQQLCRVLGPRTLIKLLFTDLAQQRPMQPNELLHNGLVVSSAYRRQGVGQKLLAAMANFCKEQNKSCLRLDALLSNRKALALYEKEGYTAEAIHYTKRDAVITLRRHL